MALSKEVARLINKEIGLVEEELEADLEWLTSIEPRVELAHKEVAACEAKLKELKGLL